MGVIPGPRDCVLLLGPVSLIAATAVAWKHERLDGWWLVAGGVSTAVLFMVDLADRPMEFLWILLVCPLPMLVAGVLWLCHAAKLALALPRNLPVFRS
ncbi:MAG: hypothetical protein IMY83_00920 [Chloroflexi bacterium]|nr:hypothetical protein [Chloroflexota bacterium]MCK4580237.1 hypothetical protein [Dehalococcoidia bacterium]